MYVWFGGTPNSEISIQPPVDGRFSDVLDVGINMDFRDYTNKM